MCGLVGFSGDFDASSLPVALAAIAHRGPDDSGTYVNAHNRIALGHRRLSIIDLSSAGHQPMISDDGKIVIVFNGEIYNFRELKVELEMKGTRFRSHSDTEVLLAMFREDGIEMLSRLNGIFALAIFDSTSDDLWLARDGLGVKPLYVFQSERGVCFSSEVKGLIPFLQNGPLTLDPETLNRLITFLWCPGNGTLLHEVRKLGPGELMRIREGKQIEQRRWYSSPQARAAVSAAMSSHEAVSAVRESLREAVRRQLVADVPVGAFLSGGLDSSAIVAFARDHAPDIRCFTIDTPGGEDSGVVADLPYAQKVAAHLGVELETVTVDSINLADEIENMIWHLDEPLADPSSLNVLHICRLAQRSGIKVMLSGAGGDDIFTGYRRHMALRYEGLWNWIPNFARNRIAALSLNFNRGSSFSRRIARLANTFAVDGNIGLAQYFVWARRADLIPLFSPKLRRQIAAVEATAPMINYLDELAPEASRIDRMLALEQRFFLADHNLTYTDKMSMAVGVEVRVPFLDNDLVALAARIPDRFKQRGHIGKWVLKKAMEPFLPHEVIYRPKTGFGAPLRRWVCEDLAGFIAERLSEERLRKRGLFDPQAVRRMIEDNFNGKIDASYTIFSLLCIEMWCSKFGDEAGLNINMTGKAV